MKYYLTTTFVSAAVMAAALASASGANAAPRGPSRVEDTVRALEADGYHVIVNRVGNGQLSSCTVRAIQPGRTYSTVDSRGGSSPVVTVISKTVQIGLLC